MSTVDVASAAPTVKLPQPKVPPKARRRWEAADTVIALVVSLVILIVAIFALLCFQGYYSTIESAKTRAQAAADIIAEETRWVISTAVTLANGAAGAFNRDPSQASAETLKRFTAVTDKMPAKLALGVYDATGTLIADASSAGVPASIADHDYFKAVAAGQDWAISAQETDSSSGRAVFSVVQRLGTPEKFTGVTLIAIDASVLEAFAAPHNLGANSAVTIVRADGWIIGRYPSLTQLTSAAPNGALDRLTAAESGSYISPASPLDGQVRIVSYRQAKDLGYIAIAAISMNTALASLWYAIWIISWLIAPIALALLVGSFVTARLLRRTQATSRSLSTALEHNEILFREIHHRVKNNLQSVSSLLQLQPIPREIKADMGQRIAAMSAVHEHIYRSNIFSRVQVKEYLRTLIDNLRAGSNPDVSVVEDLEDLAVDKDAATPLGLIVNEVVSNAFKHAFPDGRKGAVTISLKAEADGRGRLTVRDDGIGFDPDAPAKGIGRRLIGALTSQLKGEASQTSGPNGSEFTLTFPLADPV
jgi:two-component sensor histidine kinase